MSEEPNKVKLNNRGIFLFLSVVVTLAGFFTYLNAFFPHLFSILVNFFWIILLVIVVVFLALGALVIAGLQKEVSSFLDIILEGSLTILDALEFLKKLYQRFLALLKDFIFYVTPVIATWLSLLLYLIILVIYKSVGRTSDVTFLTIIISVLMVIAVAFLTKPAAEEETQIETWKMQIKKRFKNYFADSFEVIVFLFFLTMDSTNLFFLPKELNVPLHATIGDFDLMLRAADVSSQIRATVFLVSIAIGVEIVRNMLRIVIVGLDYFHKLPSTVTTVERAKEAMRLSFSSSKDDLIRFITFTTVLIIVFLVFPRLKLFAMLVASLTSLVLDFVLENRFKKKKTDDLISRIIARVFRV